MGTISRPRLSLLARSIFRPDVSGCPAVMPSERQGWLPCCASLLAGLPQSRRGLFHGLCLIRLRVRPSFHHPRRCLDGKARCSTAGRRTNLTDIHPSRSTGPFLQPRIPGPRGPRAGATGLISRPPRRARTFLSPWARSAALPLAPAVISPCCLHAESGLRSPRPLHRVCCCSMLLKRRARPPHSSLWGNPEAAIGWHPLQP